MSRKTVKHEIDLADLPPLSEKQKAELSALSGRAGSDVDYSELSTLTAAFWKDAERGKFYKPTKTSTTVRIDSDVLAWLRSQGKGYQSRINAILRREMLASLK
ncbi:BrnA antitoxin family protein [Schauerella aestuarii]|uniref:BrnA antitoxin family protein n=1 Tax=Schauerella aestuarii TaxID=2511204 RepID=UPI001367B91E|nr:BrnA antitoxin family protein [Achromobacter aestuarii]MYZ43888.1 cytoplasmic protein [Achromobacter aestuarii]